MINITVVNKRTRKDNNIYDVVRILPIGRNAKGDGPAVYRIRRKYKDGDTVTTVEQNIDVSKYDITDIREEEEWMND